jgi:hypothetical protein
MRRTITLSLLLLATAQLAVADDKPTSTLAASSTPAAESTPPTKEATDATKHRSKKSSLVAAKAADSTTIAAKAADGTADAAAGSDAAPPTGDVKMSGISILGNEDAPKSLVLVPWKSSQLGDMPSVSRLLDSATRPVDKDVFMRELSYYQFKSGSSESSGPREQPVGK